MVMGGEARSGSQAVERAMAVLNCFAGCAELTLTDVAARTSLPLSTAHRMMQALVRGGFLERHERELYRIGPNVAALLPRASVADEVAPHLHALAAGIKIAASFGVVYGDDLVTLVCARPPVRYCAAQIPAAREPLHTTAMGKALLAFDPQGLGAAAERLDNLSRSSAETLGSREAFLVDLNEVRRRGFAISDVGTDGVRAAAVPVLGGKREPLGAIGVQARSQRMTDDLVRSLVPALRHFSEKLGRLLQEHRAHRIGHGWQP
jgi:DNA-binding IclR family transcriptional regulator